jgi:23S rRNA pseudouridine1911/1915/1917 synthase
MRQEFGPQEITVPEDCGAIRIDRFAMENFHSISSRNQSRKAIKREDLLLNGEVVESSRFVQPGDVLCLKKEPPSRHKIFEIDVPVVYEDEHIAVLNKPTGLIVSGNRYRTLQNSLRHNLQASTLADAMPQPRPCHRLDAPTGGLIVSAKTASAMTKMGQLFEHRKVQKRYRALLVGRLEGEGQVDTPLEGRNALTHYKVVSHNRALKTEWQTTVDLWPHTGRTHQLRIHMARLGFPILGDALYGGDHKILKGKGLFLRSLGLEFPHPIGGEELCFELEEPSKFENQRVREARRWLQFHGETTPDPIP